jgi:hypothetical protein
MDREKRERARKKLAGTSRCDVTGRVQRAELLQTTTSKARVALLDAARTAQRAVPTFERLWTIALSRQVRWRRAPETLPRGSDTRAKVLFCAKEAFFRNCLISDRKASTCFSRSALSGLTIGKPDGRSPFSGLKMGSGFAVCGLADMKMGKLHGRDRLTGLKVSKL